MLLGFLRSSVWIAVCSGLLLVTCSKNKSRTLTPREDQIQDILNDDFSDRFEKAAAPASDPDDVRDLVSMFSNGFSYNGLSQSQALQLLGIQAASAASGEDDLSLEQIVERSAEDRQATKEPSIRLPAIENLEFSDTTQVGPNQYHVTVTAAVVAAATGEQETAERYDREAFKLSGLIEMSLVEEDGTSRIAGIRPLDVVLRRESEALPEIPSLTIAGIDPSSGSPVRVKTGDIVQAAINPTAGAGAKVSLDFNFLPISTHQDVKPPRSREPMPIDQSAPERQVDRTNPSAVEWTAPSEPGLYFLGLAVIDQRTLNAQVIEENGLQTTVYDGPPRRAIAIRYVTFPVEVTP